MNKPRKLAYSFGAVATALSYQAFATYILFFYVDTKKLAAPLAAIAMLVYGIWNAINDPIAGFISDRTRTKWGRRIPYIALGAIPFGIIYFLLWSPPFTESNMTALFVYFLSFICLFDACYTFVILNWASLYPEMFPSLEERAEVNSIRQLFGVIGLIIGIALPPLIYSRVGWSLMGLVFGGIIAGSLLISLLGSREKREFSLEEPLGIKEAIVATLKNKSFFTFVTSNLFIQYAFTMVLALLPFYAKYVLGAGPDETFRVLLSAFVVEIPMLFVWGRLAVHFGAKRIYMIAIAAFAVAILPFFFVGNVIGAMITSGLIGASLGGVIVLSDVVISDVIDEDELKTGVRREGMYFGVNAFVTRFAIAMEAASIGVVFTLTKYNPNIIIQPQAFIVGLRVLLSGFTAFGMAVAFSIMLFYPLAGTYLEEIKMRIKLVHSEKARKA